MREYFRKIGRRGGKKAAGAGIKKLNNGRSKQERIEAARKAGLASARKKRRKQKKKEKRT